MTARFILFFIKEVSFKIQIMFVRVSLGDFPCPRGARDFFA